MRGAKIEYSEAELAWIEANKTMPRRDLHAAFQERFSREDVSHTNLKALCARRGWKTGRTGCFAPGAIPANKGKKMPFNPNSAKTQFKKGNVPHNIKHLGHERISTDGYVLVSVKERNPHTGYDRRYVEKHRHEWIKANGPIPEGHVLKCLDGDKTNCDPSNWQAIPQAMLPRLNGRFGRGYDDAAVEVKPTIMAVATLEHMARSAKAGAND